ncbi:helix-turn-helix domain-containing protein [Mycobacterium paraintracellulare]|uniref:helix-turn-helix domain-containing protein n=1 Tax=Mycobacterium paraintracellulare TaxID=1138383 RepID=UPI00191570EF|nr:helix-turn-helix transcriptional regulator [Mycobacterium paraintracellulare]
MMIVHTSEMPAKRNPLGPTGETVRENVIALRERKNLSYAQLSRKLKAAGRAIPELGLRRIEDGERRVDVDDLMALAEALEVWPIALLMPTTTMDGQPVQTGDELVQATCRPLESAKFLWNRLQGLLIMGFGEATEATLQGTADYRRFIESTPPWAVKDTLGKVYRGHD